MYEYHRYFNANFLVQELSLLTTTTQSLALLVKQRVRRGYELTLNTISQFIKRFNKKTKWFHRL